MIYIILKYSIKQKIDAHAEQLYGTWNFGRARSTIYIACLVNDVAI